MERNNPSKRRYRNYPVATHHFIFLTSLSAAPSFLTASVIAIASGCARPLAVCQQCQNEQLITVYFRLHFDFSPDMVFPLLAAIRCPCIHQASPLLKEIATPVSAHDLAFDRMRERHFHDLGWKVRFLRCPVPERAAKAVNGEPRAQAAQKFQHRHVRQRPPTTGAWEHIGRALDLRQPSDDGRGPVRKEERDGRQMPSCVSPAHARHFRSDRTRKAWPKSPPRCAQRSGS